MKTTRKLMISAGLLLTSLTLHGGELTPEESLKRLSQNVETSTKNRDELNKAIQQIGENISTLESASLDLQNQKKRLEQQLTENKSTLDLHSKKIQELDRNLQDEERKRQEDAAKIAQLEKTLSQLKEIQKMRADRVQKLTADRTTLEASKKQGADLQLSLAGETKKIDQRIETLGKEVLPWREKQKVYQKEAARWSGEVERHQKMEAEVKLLLDSTT